MSESIPATWNDDRGAAFFSITGAVASESFASDAPRPSAAFGGADLAARLDKILDDLPGAESWESMARRSVTRSAPHTVNWSPCRPPRDAGRLDREPVRITDARKRYWCRSA